MRRNHSYTNKDLNQFRYPNLVAEFLETGYSLCTLSECMGHGSCGESDFLIKSKLYGQVDITTGEAVGLAKLFSCPMEYLFSHELKTTEDGYTYAFARHLDDNIRQAKEFEQYKGRKEIDDTLKERPELIKFVKFCLTLSETEMKGICTNHLEIA